MRALLLQLLLLLVFLTTPVYSGYCYRTKCVSKRVRVCIYSTWEGCCVYKTVWKTVVTKERYCCPGFRGSGCRTPICNPPCANGGTCGPRPGQCRCLPGFEGPSCRGIARCSFGSPCYPGVCDRRCSCQTGFTNDTCLALQNDQAPRVWQATVRLASLKTSPNPRLNGMLLYEVMADSSNPDVDEDDVIWSNQKGFNLLEVFGAAQFEPEDLPPTPDYVNSANFGVTEAVATVTQTKIRTDGPGRRTIDPRSYPCKELDGKQVISFWNCSVFDPNFNQLISNGDELGVTLKFTSGGKRLLRDPAGRRREKTESYSPVVSQKRVIFKFDLEKPSHCSKKNERNCLPPLSINQDITESAVQISWGGWTDDLSKMYRYAWEVFPLRPVTAQGELGEQEPLKPLINQGVLANETYEVSFTPPSPGVYSVILEASDLANNSRFARRIFIYDNQSDVTFDDVSPLFISTAEAGSDYAWQTDLNGDIIVTWIGHFRNELHDREKMLNKVIPYPVQFTDTENVVGDNGKFTLKRVDFDDDEGKRTTAAIPNTHGIVKFEISHAKEDSTVLASPSSWTSVDGHSEQFTISGLQRSNGERLRVWIRATDIIGRQKVDETFVNFDDSLPIFKMDQIQKNIKDGVYPFSSRVTMNASDSESGLQSVTYRLLRNSNGEVQESGQLDLVPYRLTEDQCTRREDCKCTPFTGCFIRKLSLVINHCWLVVDKASLESEVINLEVNVTNSAMLVARDTLKIRNIPSYRGIGQYSAPSNVRVIRQGFNTVRISWNNTPSCYNITELWINYTGAAKKEKIHRLSIFYDLTGLQPETNYTAQLITGYNGEMSNPVTFVFKTDPAPPPVALSSGAKAGIGIGLALFVLLIVVGSVLLWYFGIIAVALGRKKEGKMTKAAVAFSRMSRKVRGAAVDDDIYVYGGDNFDIPLGVQIAASRLTLEELIAEGKFARVYRASLSSSARNEKETVVAKMAKESGDPYDRQLMKGKILFYINEVGEHRNVLRMIGAMMENDDYGPVMILEHCEMGPLRSWLVSQKDHVNDDVIERMFQFSLGVVSGMAYLANTGIVHRRLAARNILLTFVLEVRISGFGPTQITEEGEDSNPESNQQEERIPIRWVAPECFKSTRDATEKSDVWSYGVVLWEIFSLGDNPYPTLKTHEIPARVKGGHRMSRPEYADDFNYQMMNDCWEREARRRPKFKELEKVYRAFMTGTDNVGYSENPYT